MSSSFSGVTKAGVPGVATDGVTYFPLQKTDNPFLVINSLRDLFPAVVSSPLPPSDVVYPVFFLKLSHKKN